MQEAFIRIIDFFDMFGKLLVVLLTSTAQLFVPLLDVFKFLKSLVSCIPPVVVPFFLAGIAVSILLLFLGRN